MLKHIEGSLEVRRWVGDTRRRLMNYQSGETKSRKRDK